MLSRSPFTRTIISLSFIVLGSYGCLYGLAYTAWLQLFSGVSLLLWGCFLRKPECQHGGAAARHLQINWWLWVTISTPPIIYSWLRPREGKAEGMSDWEYLTDYLQLTEYSITRDIWNYFIQTLIWSAALPLLIGWIAQYLIMLAWDLWRQRGRVQPINQ